jgi:hypothetical protein
MPLDDLELRARYPPVDAIGNPILTAQSSDLHAIKNLTTVTLHEVPIGSNGK